MKDREIPPDIRALFDDAEMATIAAHPVILGESTERDAIDLAMAWQLHVAKIDSDRALPWSDRSVWTEHDLVAALYMRDFVQLALDRLPTGLRERLQPVVDRTDQRFRSFTVDDPLAKIEKIAQIQAAGRGWWWRRVPTDGPIAQDLAGY